MPFATLGSLSIVSTASFSSLPLPYSSRCLFLHSMLPFLCSAFTSSPSPLWSFRPGTRDLARDPCGDSPWPFCLQHQAVFESHAGQCQCYPMPFTQTLSPPCFSLRTYSCCILYHLSAKLELESHTALNCMSQVSSTRPSASCPDPLSTRLPPGSTQEDPSSFPDRGAKEDLP